MRIEVLSPLGPDAEVELRREIGAVVARGTPAGGVAIELGPADGAPVLRLVVSAAEAARLRATLQAILNGRDEEIMLTEDERR